MSKNDIIPEDVVNIDAYRKYQELSNHPLLLTKTITVSTGEVVKLGILPHMFTQAIAHLPLEEREKLQEMKSEYMAILGMRNFQKLYAFGRDEKTLREKKQLSALTPFEADIIELLGRLFTVPEVMKIMGEDNGVECTEKEVRDILAKNIVIIERKREEFRNKVSDVRLYNKRSRLEELAWMYSRMKNRYIAVGSSDAYNNMLKTLEQIRKEAEGDVLTVNGILDVNIEATIQEQVYKETLKTINLKEIILGRVAARMNYDLGKLVQGLHNSYYAAHISYTPDFDPEAEMHYPSAEMYDFDRIEATAGREVVDITAEEVKTEEKTQAQNIKESFLAKIRRMKEDEEMRERTKDIFGENKLDRDMEKEEVYKRGAGRGKDKRPTNLVSKSKYIRRDRDYKTGKRIDERDKK